MNSSLSLRAIAVGLAALFVSACGEDDDAKNDRTTEEQTITAIAAADAQFSTLVGLLQDTGLDVALDGEGTFTVFAPTNAAFEALPSGVLASLTTQQVSDILNYHVLGSEVDAAGAIAAAGTSVPTNLNGESIDVAVYGSGADATVVLDGLVQVVETDIVASNGIIHVVDAVLLPLPEFPGTSLDAVSAYPILSELLGAAGGVTSVTDALSGNSDFTLFAPINAGFEAISSTVAGLTSAQLETVLLYHALSGEISATDVVALDGSSTGTAASQDISIALSNGSVTLNGSTTVLYTDVFTSNGVIHVVDSVLIPPVL